MSVFSKDQSVIFIYDAHAGGSYANDIASYIRQSDEEVIVIDTYDRNLLKNIDSVLRNNKSIKCAFAVSLESAKAVHHLWRHDILSALIMPEDGNAKESCRESGKYTFCVGSFIFASQEQRFKTLELLPDLKSIKYSIASPGNHGEFKETLKDLGNTLSARMAKEESDRASISRSPLFNSSFAGPWHGRDKNQAIAAYTSSWRTGVHMRNPFPGFHPGIYAELCHLPDSDPFAHYLAAGKPSGPWNVDVITPSTFGFKKRRSNLRAALHIHLFYPDMSADLIRRIRKSRSAPDLFISVPSQGALAEARSHFSQFADRKVEIKMVPNAGRDIGPLLTEFGAELQNYEVVGHVHTKKSLYQEKRSLIDQWSSFLYENSIGGKKPMIDIVLQSFEKDPLKGIIYPDDPNVFGWTNNKEIALGLMERMQLKSKLSGDAINFPVGTMFWARPEALKPLFDLKLEWSDYPEEPLPDDGTMLHAIERIIPSVVKEMGFREAVTYVKGVSR